MSRNSDKDEALFTILSAGDDPRVAFEHSDLARDPYCRKRFAEITGMADDLDALGTEERQALRVALERGSLPSGDAEEALRREILGPGKSGRRWWPLLLAAAIAAVFALPFVLGDGDDALDGLDASLRLGAPTEMSPIGPIEALEGFSWKHRGGASGFYIVLVYDGGTGEQILVSPQLSLPEWRPEPDEIALLLAGPRPRDLRWELAIYDGSGPDAETYSRDFSLQ
ncbi:MAG: hypothetical protein GY711_28675 [bacterium]|nr:hypothetical protein [bacterium]